MLPRLALSLTILVGLASLGCRPASSPSPARSPRAGAVAPEPREERARAALGVLKRELMAALSSALADGPEAAVTACRDEAPRLTAAASVDGLRVGRSSHRLRNPANAPEAWLEPLLQRYVEGEQAPFLTAELPEGALGFVEPIRLQALCTTCHGTDVESSLSSRIAELYPSDTATGFHEGELRGVFWAVVPGSP